MADLKISVDKSELVGLIKTTDQTKQAVRLMGAEFARTGNQSAYLRSINQVVAAQSKLPAAMRMSRKEIMALGQQYRQQAAFTDELTRAQMQLNAATQTSARGINRSGVLMQQTGYQVGDFIVQVQSGTNAFVAFGQQATQVAGTLTMLGGSWLKIGSVLGIAIPLLTAVGAAFMRTRQQAEEATDSVEEFASRTRDMFAEIQAFATGMTVEEIAQRRRLIELELERIKLIEERNYLESIGAITTGAEDLIAENEKRQEQIREELELRQRANELQERNERITEMAREAARRFFEERRKAEEEAARIAQERENFLTTETANLQQQIDILGVALQYGKDSIQVEEARAAQAREAYLLEVMRQGIYGEQLQSLMDIYDEYTKLNLALSKPVQGPVLPTDDDTDTPPRGRTATRTITDIINKRQQQLNQELELLEISRDRAAARAIEFELENQYQGEVTDTMREQIQAAAESMAAQEEQIRKLEEIRDRNKEVADTIADSFGKALMSVVDGTKSTSEAFKDMARQIISELYRIYVIKKITGFIAGGIDNLLGGGAGITGSNYSGGSMRANEPYLVGENGPELVIPRKSSTVVNADLTSKALGGGGGETIVVNQTINVSTGVQQTVRNEIQNLMPQISEAAKSAVVDAKRRGGSYGRAFG